MTREDKIRALTMRIDGRTYQEISECFGVSKQCIYHVLTGIIQGDTKKNIAFPAIRNWMHENHISVKGILQRADDNVFSYQSLRRGLSGERMFKSNEINELLRITGLDYKEVFWERKNPQEVGASQGKR